MSVPDIVFENVSKIFTSRGRIVDAMGPVSFEVGAREFVAIVGPSGCGKSTLLNMAAGLLEPTAGSLRILGEPLRSVNTRAAYMTQQDSLLPWRTVEKNIVLPLEITREIPPSDQRQLVDDIIKLVGLDGFARSYPAELSGGMRKRVALARALTQRPNILLMDEPFGALDAQLRTVMHQELLRVWETRSLSAVLVTHDLQEAVTLADKIICLSPRPGRVVDIIDVPLPRPRNVFGLQFTEEFASVYRKVWEANGQHDVVGETIDATTH